MQEAELDRFLRNHSELERLLLTPGALQRNLPESELAEIVDKNNPKAPPLTKGHLIDALTQADNVTLREDLFVPHGRDIAFSVQPRYAELPCHRHTFIEMIYVYDGKFRNDIDGRPTYLQKGELCILDPHTYHRSGLCGRNDIIINCLIRNSFFDASLFGRLINNDVFSRFFIKSVCHSKNYYDHIVLHTGDNPKIQQLMKMVLCEYFDQGRCSHEVIKSYMVILFAEMLKVFEKDINRKNLPVLKNMKVSDIVLYIQQNFKEVTLESVAHQFRFHPTYLSKILKKLTGMGFIDIVHQVKINQACVLLKTTNLPVTMVANDVGYENIGFFYRIFNKQFGCTPAVYRKTWLPKDGDIVGLAPH